MAKAGRRRNAEAADKAVANPFPLFSALLESLRASGVFSSPAFLGSVGLASAPLIAPRGHCPYCDNRRAENAVSARRYRERRASATQPPDKE